MLLLLFVCLFSVVVVGAVVVAVVAVVVVVAVVAVFAVNYSKIVANGHLPLLKSYRNCP